MPNGERNVCRKCRDTGRILVYEAPIVIRKCCVCEAGKKRKEYLEKLTKNKEDTIVWELLSI